MEGLDDVVLGVGGGEAPELDEQTVPAAVICVAVPEGAEGEVCGAPSVGGDDVVVGR